MKIPPFLIELVQRFAKKNPLFFQYIQLASGIVALVAFLPDLAAFLDVKLPSFFEVLHDKTVKIGAFITILIAQLPNKDAGQPTPEQ